MTETRAAETQIQEENLALKQLCRDRHLPDIANNIENWGALLAHNIKINTLFEENFKARELIHHKQQQFEFLKLWKNIFLNKATYHNLCENFRSTQNTKAETFTKHLSVSSLKDIIKGIINSNLDLFVRELDAERVLELMKNESLLTADDVEMFEGISTEKQKCKHICLMLKYSSLICFRKFILLLSENHLHVTIVAKILEDLKINETYHFLSSSLKYECSLDDTSQVMHESTSSRKRKREEINKSFCKGDLTVPHSKYFKPSELSVCFAELVDELLDCLQCCEVARLITKFNVLMADHASNIPFFPQKLLYKLYQCKTVEDLFLKLSPYLSWQRLHILQLLVDASKSEEAKELLENFKSKVDETYPVMEYNFGPASKRIVPAENSSEALVCTKSITDDMSLHDANVIKRALADSTGIEEHSIELIATQTGSIILYWLVLRSVIGLIIEGVFNNLSLFYGMGIVEVCIDPSIVITTVTGLRTRSLFYLTELPTEIEELSSAITKLHVDLLTHCKPPLASEQSDFKSRVEDLQLKCQMLSDKADSDIFSLKVRFKQLEDAKKQADEVSKLQLSQIQSSYSEMESKLSVVEAENLSLKSEKRSLISRVSAARDQASPLRKANETIEKLLKEIASLKEEKMSTEKRVDTAAIHSLSEEDPEKFASNWRSTVFENVQFGRPDAIAVGPNHELLICDYKHQCVFMLDSELNLLNTLGTTGDGRLTHPNGIAIDEDGTIAVSDYRFHQVKKFLLTDGKYICSIGAPGPEDGNFDYPRGLAFSSDGFLYVMDWGNSRIQVFNKQNEFAFKFGTQGLGPSEFDHPTRIAMDGSDNVYVANYNSSTIGIFTNLGKFITSIATNKPFAVAVTSTGYIFADDHDKNQIKMWNPKHQLVGQFGKEGDQKGEFNSITDMATGKDRLCVVDARNKRLQFIEGIDW